MQLGAHTTTDEVLADVDLSGKRILITGVSAGLGVETARSLASRGAVVVGAARDIDKARSATEGVEGDFTLEELDLASLNSVRPCTDRLVADGRPFDIIIDNAGVMATVESRTVDGFETQFGTNHLGHFALVNRLVPLIADGGRLVNLSSMGHRRADVSLDDPDFETDAYDPWVAYSRSKTANILFAVEFDCRHRARGIRAAAVHPGGFETELGRHMPEEAKAALIASISAARPKERRRSVTKRFRKAPPPPFGAALQHRVTKLAAATAQTAMWQKSSTTRRSAGAFAAMHSIRRMQKRCGPEARN